MTSRLYPEATSKLPRSDGPEDHHHPTAARKLSTGVRLVRERKRGPKPKPLLAGDETLER